MNDSVSSARSSPSVPTTTMSERLALVGFLAGYSGPTRESYRTDLRTVLRLAHRPASAASRRSAHPHRAVRPLARRTRPSPSDGRAAAVDLGRVLPLLRTRTDPRTLPGGSCAATEAGLRVPDPRIGPQRARRLPGRRRAVIEPGPRVGVAAGLERAADLRGARCRHRAAQRRTRSPHAADRAQGRQARHHPARPSHRPSDRPGHRRPRHGPILLGAIGHASIATRQPGSCAGWLEPPGSTSGSRPTACGTASSPPPSTPASRCAMSKTPPPTPIRAPRCATTGPATASTATPPTSCPPSSPAPADSRNDQVTRPGAEPGRVAPAPPIDENGQCVTAWDAASACSRMTRGHCGGSASAMAAPFGLFRVLEWLWTIQAAKLAQPDELVVEELTNAGSWPQGREKRGAWPVVLGRGGAA